jgi:hypothetical protein
MHASGDILQASAITPALQEHESASVHRAASAATRKEQSKSGGQAHLCRRRLQRAPASSQQALPWQPLLRAMLRGRAWALARPQARPAPTPRARSRSPTPAHINHFFPRSLSLPSHQRPLLSTITHETRQSGSCHYDVQSGVIEARTCSGAAATVLTAFARSPLRKRTSFRGPACPLGQAGACAHATACTPRQPCCCCSGHRLHESLEMLSQGSPHKMHPFAYPYQLRQRAQGALRVLNPRLNIAPFYRIAPGATARALTHPTPK